jgi:hypothetical protein
MRHLKNKFLNIHLRRFIADRFMKNLINKLISYIISKNLILMRRKMFEKYLKDYKYKIITLN